MVDLKKTPSPINEDEEVVTGPELDNWLRISSVTRWRWTRSGILPPPRKLHPGGANIYLKSQIKELIDSAPIADAYQGLIANDAANKRAAQ